MGALVAASFRGRPQAGVDALVRKHIETAATLDWLAMVSQNASLTVVRKALAGAVHFAIGCSRERTVEMREQLPTV